MKNLMIYTGNDLKGEDEVLARIQIDNSLDLGWESKDILFITDFPYEYNGVRSLVIPRGNMYKFDSRANKIAVVLYLLENSMLEYGELYWCHDLDAFELNRITEEELELEDKSLGLIHYFYKKEWCLSSFFFTIAAERIIKLLHDTTVLRPWSTRNNEKTLTWLIKHGRITKNQYKKLNVTYNIAKRCLETVYKEAKKPIKILHFRPSDKDKLMEHTALEMFMYGKNSLKMPLMTDRLINIFKNHGIQ